MSLGGPAALVLSALAAGPRGVDGPQAQEQARVCVSSVGVKSVEACRAALGLGLGVRRAAVVHRALAQRLEALDQWDGVVEVYRDLIRLQPDDPDAHLRLAATLVDGLDRPEEALASCHQALALKSDQARAHGLLGLALNALGRHAEAVAAFEEALRLDPAYLDGRPATRLVVAAARRGEKWP